MGSNLLEAPCYNLLKILDLNITPAANFPHTNHFNLIRKVLLASTALPGLFPPVYIEVTSGGKTYKEMHVDGGTTDNAFLLPLHLNLNKIDKRNRVHWRRRLFIIANAKTKPSPKVVKGTTLEIAGRSISTPVRTQYRS